MVITALAQPVRDQEEDRGQWSAEGQGTDGMLLVDPAATDVESEADCGNDQHHGGKKQESARPDGFPPQQTEGGQQVGQRCNEIGRCARYR